LEYLNTHCFQCDKQLENDCYKINGLNSSTNYCNQKCYDINWASFVKNVNKEKIGVNQRKFI
jgi:hypothetical protein